MNHRLGTHQAQSKMMGRGRLLGRGQASAFFLFGKKISTGMYHTGHDFDTGIKSFQPLDEWK
jgi:hypothetical protein